MDGLLTNDGDVWKIVELAAIFSLGAVMFTSAVGFITGILLGFLRVLTSYLYDSIVDNGDEVEELEPKTTDKSTSFSVSDKKDEKGEEWVLIAEHQRVSSSSSRGAAKVKPEAQNGLHGANEVGVHDKKDNLEGSKTISVSITSSSAPCKLLQSVNLSRLVIQEEGLTDFVAEEVVDTGAEINLSFEESDEAGSEEEEETHDKRPRPQAEKNQSKVKEKSSKVETENGDPKKRTPEKNQGQPGGEQHSAKVEKPSEMEEKGDPKEAAFATEMPVTQQTGAALHRAGGKGKAHRKKKKVTFQLKTSKEGHDVGPSSSIPIPAPVSEPSPLWQKRRANTLP